jgi:hypothetical protein
MKGSAACLDIIANVEITALGAACTDNLVLSTSVCYKPIKCVDTAKGLKTSGQVITIEFQPICNGEDAHT